MFSFLGFGKNKIKKALQNGGVVIDVRMPHEFDQGKVPGAINIPVDRIYSSIERIKAMKKPVVVCCASGLQCRVAKNILKSAGVKEVYNGGNWGSVLKIKNKL